jgi:hypothetical protein
MDDGCESICNLRLVCGGRFVVVEGEGMMGQDARGVFETGSD